MKTLHLCLFALLILLGACSERENTADMRSYPSKSQTAPSVNYCGVFSKAVGHCVGSGGNCVCPVTVRPPAPRPPKDCLCLFRGVAGNPVGGSSAEVAAFFGNGDEVMALFPYMADTEYSTLRDWLIAGPQGQRVSVGDVDYILFSNDSEALANGEAEVVLRIDYSEDK